MHTSPTSQSAFTLIELLWSLAIAAVLIAGLAGVVGGALEVEDDTTLRNEATRQARFAMQRMVNATRRSDRLILPLADNPNTNWPEHVREQSNPPVAPVGDSTLATAVLALTLGPGLDRDEDGWADANNDRDFFDLNKNSVRDAGEPERIDEDAGADVSNDKLPGIAGIDDNGDGSIDISAAATPGNDDDEDNVADEDRRNGSDTDGDGAVDEDWAADVESDGQAGIAGIDDDLDLTADEGFPQDDDEDGNTDEDWLDSVVFHLLGDTLMERSPNLNPVDGNDYSEYAIAEHVSYFRVERVAVPGKRAVLVAIILGLSLPDAEPMQLSTRVRVGGGL